MASEHFNAPLRVPALEAWESLTNLANRGFALYHTLNNEYLQKRANRTWDRQLDRTALLERANGWFAELDILESVFPTDVEIYQLQSITTAILPWRVVNHDKQDVEAENLLRRFLLVLEKLVEIRDTQLLRPLANPSTTGSEIVPPETKANVSQDAQLSDPIPIAWLRSVVPQKMIKGASDKIAAYLRCRKVTLVKRANRLHCERSAAIGAFVGHPKIQKHIQEFGADSD